MVADLDLHFVHASEVLEFAMGMIERGHTPFHWLFRIALELSL